MTWYAAHILIAITIREEKNGPIRVWENVVLIEASDAAHAMQQAQDVGRADAAMDDGLEINGKPAVREFAGIRKIINVSNPPHLSLDRDRPVSGTEITYSEIVVVDRAALKALARGESVTVEYLE